MKEKRMTRPMQLIIGALVLILALFIAVSLFIWKAGLPYHNARSEAIAIAQKASKLKKVTAFDIATTDETVYAIEGTDASGEKLGVLIPKEGSKITQVKLSEGVDPESLTKSDTTSIVLASYQNQPAWEVNNKSGFALYDFKTGKELMTS
ncbi:cell wall elongation regulator TseB-like domain-containing protein [Lactococcus termiticola]|uniref:Cell wall elongation regulator TseB-like domain-containing protein n=1 Tax=Lactococcus termiticola TaxID=2169526 RepID=A0A2R5HFX9_9LACT|nr:DUF5590 domain-containing protein [Lactococcus termiticola]GBG96235.1 hypothetical protein NtB2_00346 [Lactococcus termiticola]